MKRFFFAVLAVAVLTPFARAQMDHSVYGLELGKPLSLRECSLKKLYGKTYGYSYQDASVCFQHQPAKFGEVWLARNSVSTPAVNEAVKIMFPIGQQPQITVGDLIGLVVDGKLQGVTMKTGGVRTWDIVLDALTKKYGDPSTRHDLHEGNLAGAQIPVVLATWSTPELTVEFISALPSDVTEGSVKVYTSILAAKMKAANPTPTDPKL